MMHGNVPSVKEENFMCKEHKTTFFVFFSLSVKITVHWSKIIFFHYDDKEQLLGNSKIGGGSHASIFIPNSKISKS